MPFISRLKRLGELPVPELQTTLTVYLIYLEDSEETNLVYTSSNPIPADASPPANLRFESPEACSKRGDVLIWASRIHKKACYVHACWVFEGHRWVKPNSNSEIMMDHPVHPDYQLVVLSGPYIKWELKPDPDREPSLTLPDPPHVRPGARGTMNTIFPSSSSSSLPPQQCAENSERADHRRYPRPRSSDPASDTPDGSAAMCSSSRFSTPLSDIAEDQKPDIGSYIFPSQSAIPYGIVPKALRPSPSFSLSPSTRIGLVRPARPSNPEIPTTRSERFRSVSAESTSRTRAVRQRPKGGRSMPSGRDLTPNTGVPPTPDSSTRTRSRRLVRSTTAPEKPSKPPLTRRRKRHPSDAGSPPPAKRRRLGTSNLVLKLPSREAENNSREGGEDDDCQSPADSDSLWSQLEELQREKDTLASRVKEAADLHARLAREAKDRDHVVRELRRQLTEAQPPNPQRDSAVDQAGNILDFQRLNEEVSKQQKLVQDELYAATLRIRQLEAERTATEAATPRTGLEDVSLLRTERDNAHRTIDEIRTELEEMRKQRDSALAEAKDAKRAANDIAVARANDVAVSFRNIKDLRDQKTQLETDLAHSKRDLEMRLTAFRPEGAKPSQETQFHGLSRPRQPVKVEEVVVELEEQRRRAASFESSLRVAQEALQRQRTRAQETEVLQRKTIQQLAKELREKEQSAKEIGENVDNLERQLTELQNSFLAGDNALKQEREEGRRVKDEIKRIKESAQADRVQIASLQATATANSNEITTSENKIRECETLIEHMRQEKKAHDTALAEEIRIRTEYEAELLELRRSASELKELHRKAEQHVDEERTAKLALQSELEVQRIACSEYLSISGRERRRLDELFLECRSSLQLKLMSKTRDLEVSLTELATLKAKCYSDREQFTAELAACKERQAETTKVCESMEVEIEKYRTEATLVSQALAESRLEFAASMKKISLERNRLSHELSDVRNKLEEASSACEFERTESLAGRRRIEEELSALQLQFRSQSQDLESARAECVQLKAEASSTRQQLTSELSLMSGRLEDQSRASQEELAAIRHKHKAAEHALQAQCISNELKARRTVELLRETKEDSERLQELLRADCARLEADLSSTREKLTSLDSLLVTANQTKLEIEGRLADELLLKDQLSSENASKFKKLEDLRADLEKTRSDLASARQLAQDAASRQEDLQRDLSASKSTSVLAAEEGKRELAKLHMELRSMTSGIEESKAECSCLKAELQSERERFCAERSLSKDDLRCKLSSTEARLELEKTTAQKLRKQLATAKEQSSNYWSDLGSNLLRSLHEVQDKLKVEQIARQALQDELLLEREKVQAQGVGIYGLQENNA